MPTEVVIDNHISVNKEKDKPLPLSNTPFYDNYPEGSVRILDQDWVKQKCETKITVQLKQKPNRALPIPDYVTNSISEEIQRLCSLHCTHVYKYTCRTTLKQNYCYAVLIKKKMGTNKPF